MTHPAAFKRMVLGLPQNTKDYGSVAFTAELADLLGLDLVGVFAADEGLRDIAALSCVRELRASGGWHRIDAEQLERGSNQAAADARRLFGEATKALREGAHFDLAKGGIDEAVGSQSMPDDIVVVIEPKNPAERVTYQFKQLLNTALSSAAAVLLVPSHVVRRHGPIIAVATDERDPCIQAALRVAESSHEKLRVFVPADADENHLARSLSSSSIPVDQRRMRRGDLGISELGFLLAGERERFVVMSRGRNSHLPSQLAFARSVPVLVTESLGSLA